MIQIINFNDSFASSGFMFNRDNGVSVVKFDAGYPDVRESSDPRSQGHGMVDYTRFFGARKISIDFTIYPKWASYETNKQEIIDRLSSFCNPSIRPYIYKRTDNVDEDRRIMVRSDSLSAPFQFPTIAQAQMSWIAPSGLWESAQLFTHEIFPSYAEQLDTGRSYDLTFDRAYDSRDPSGYLELNVGGTIESYPGFIIYGPATSATIWNRTTGLKMHFPTLTLGVNDSIEIDNLNRSIKLGGQPNVSFYDKVDWSQSSWVTLATGVNLFSFSAIGNSLSTKLSMAYRHNWI